MIRILILLSGIFNYQISTSANRHTNAGCN